MLSCPHAASGRATSAASPPRTARRVRVDCIIGPPDKPVKGCSEERPLGYRLMFFRRVPYGPIRIQPVPCRSRIE
ncbi:hypothetical protein [Streptomyces noursei]|uniref:hypothetical protein n=1 Tax=Streptomyces noursei TaxID=1971 RepID=UPI0035E20241